MRFSQLLNGGSQSGSRCKHIINKQNTFVSDPLRMDADKSLFKIFQTGTSAQCRLTLAVFHPLQGIAVRQIQIFCDAFSQQFSLIVSAQQTAPPVSGN